MVRVGVVGAMGKYCPFYESTIDRLWSNRAL